jgi:3',5'-cyclic AMP phosphodiesterase CpdA
MNSDPNDYSDNITIAERFFLKTGRGGFLFAVTNDEFAQQDINNILQFRLLGKGKALRIHDWQKDGEGLHPVEQLRSLIKSYPDTGGVILAGLDAALDQNPNLFVQLNFGREALSALGIPLLFWLSSASLHRISFEAIDLYNQRASSNLYFETTDTDHTALYSVAQETLNTNKNLRFIEARMTLLEQQLEEAEKNQRDSAEIAEEIVLELLPLYAEIPDKTQSIQLLLDRYFNEFDLQKPEQCTVAADAFNALGDVEKAHFLIERALLRYRELAGGNPQTNRSSEAKMLGKLANVQKSQHEFTAAEHSYQEALNIYRELAQAKSSIFLSDVAGTLVNLANVQAALNNFTAAEHSCQEALDIYHELAHINPQNYLPYVAATLQNLANLKTMRNDNRAAEQGYQEALKITGELASAVTWLHVSDFHMTDGAPYDQEVILRSLVESVKRFKQEGHAPDLIFATGDISNSGKAREYEQATKFFDDLLKAAGLGKERLFIVPGNHDVDRKAGEFLARTINSADSADRCFSPDQPFPHLTLKFHAFREWYNDYFRNIRTFPVNTTCSQVEIVTIRNSKVAVLPLNSALFCIGDDDHEKLFIGRRCLDEAKKQSGKLESDLKIALTHHPLDWLSPVEQANIKSMLAESVDVVLQGHFHQVVTESILSTSGGYLQLAAGASYQTGKYPKSAIYATFYQSQVTIFPIRYEDTPREEWTLDTSVFPSPSYIGLFALPGRTNPALKQVALNPDKESKLHAKEAERYQNTLKEELGFIRMLGLPGVESVKVNLNDHTFVPLRFSRGQDPDGYFEKKSIPQEFGKGQILTPDRVMLEAFRLRRMLLVIGDPGAGKTTLLKYYALCALEEDHYKRLGFSGPVKVFYLPLRELRRKKSGRYDSLPANLAFWSESHHKPLEARVFDEWLQAGTSLVLLDGLDEISNREERIKVCHWIDRAWSGFSKAFFVVTSRATGYRKDEGIELATDYERADVQDFTKDQQERFLSNWFSAAFLREPCDEDADKGEWQRRQQAKAAERTEKMVAYLKREKNRGLRQLAAVPMILQIMAILWKNRDFLPESRVDLYDAVLDYLLELRDKRREIAVLMPAKRARMVLGPVSLWMQEELKTDEADRGEMQAQMQERLGILKDKEYTPPSVDEFCAHLVNRAGLLVEYGSNVYMFRHKSFREYLAGVELVKKVRSGTAHLDTLILGFGDDWWEEPLKFFIAQEDEEIFDLFMEKLFDSPVTEVFSQKKEELLLTLIEEAPEKKVDALCKKLLDPLTTAPRQRVLLDCLKAIGKPAALDALQQFMAKKLANKNKDIADRAEECFLALGGQQSELETSSSFRNPKEQNAEYILIPAGRYIYSDTGKEESVEELYVAKYPVTNRLYRLFIASLQTKERGFRDELNAIAKNNRWDKGFGDYLKEGTNDIAALFRSEQDNDRKFGGDDQPVVGVTWYAARAYALWLSRQEEGKAGLYRLPTGIEWEWAAGGRQREAVQRVRPYPWPEEKGEPTPKLANYGMHAGATTPVGSYPEGATPEGLYDMAGNVWEWCSDSEGSIRVLRGGGWGYAAESCRSAFRDSGPPGRRGGGVGFRLVFVP